MKHSSIRLAGTHWLLPFTVLVGTQWLLLFTVLLGLCLFSSGIWFFHVLHKEYEDSVSRNISLVLQSNHSHIDGEKITKQLLAFKDLGMIDCVVVSQYKPVHRTFYDGATSGRCPQSTVSRTSFKATNGSYWSVGFVIPEANIFIWLKAAAASTLLVILILLYFCAKRVIERLSHRAMCSERETQWVSQIALQARHDVASPLSAVKVVASHPELSLKMRQILLRSIERSESIMADLKLVKHGEETFSSIDLLRAVEVLMEEKNFPHYHFTYDIQPFVVARKSALNRVLSNILGNAIEARSVEPIECSVKTCGDSVELSIVNDGLSVTEEVVRNLGRVPTTVGKAGGSGLGLYHAVHELKRMNGRLKLVARPQGGTVATITLMTDEIRAVRRV